MRRIKTIAIVLLAFVLSGCTEITSILMPPTPTPSQITTEATTTAQPSPTLIGNADTTLTIWVENRFYTSPDSTATILLQDRLNAFEDRHPGLKIQLRVKANSGSAGMIATLASARVAAPALVPDIVLLNQNNLLAGLDKDLLYPLDGLAEKPEYYNWHVHATSCATMFDGYYNLPFASDLIGMAYRLDRYDEIPANWSDILNTPAAFVFPANDPQAELILGQYRSLGGEFYNDEDQPFLDRSILEEVFSYYESAYIVGILPESNASYTTPEETWGVLHDGRAGIAVAPLSSFLQEHNPTIEAMLPIPTRQDTNFVLGDCWSWAVTQINPDQSLLISELLTWLSVPEFLGTWTEALGLVPSSTIALDMWADENNQQVANVLLQKTEPPLSDNVLFSYGPVITEAVLNVIAGNISAKDAANTVTTQIMYP